MRRRPLERFYEAVEVLTEARRVKFKRVKPHPYPDKDDPNDPARGYMGDATFEIMFIPKSKQQRSLFLSTVKALGFKPSKLGRYVSEKDARYYGFKHGGYYDWEMKGADLAALYHALTERSIDIEVKVDDGFDERDYVLVGKATTKRPISYKKAHAKMITALNRANIVSKVEKPFYSDQRSFVIILLNDQVKLSKLGGGGPRFDKLKKIYDDAMGEVGVPNYATGGVHHEYVVPFLVVWADKISKVRRWQ